MKIKCAAAFLLFSLPILGQVTYNVTVPAGTNACFIAGEMTGWNQMQMEKQSANVYTLTISWANISQQYKYYSGPAWNYSETTASGANISNRSYSATDIVAKWAIVWDFTNNFPPAVSSGNIVRHWFTSDLVDDRYIDVWLPEGYNSSYKYSVLYMHDGQMLFDPSKSWNGKAWGVDSTLGSLIGLGSIERTIVVGIHNNGNKRHAEYFPEKVINNIPEPQKSSLESLFFGSTRADDYLRFIVTELKPFIDATYSTFPDQQHTFIAGSSMGGLISLYAFCEYPDIFSRAACLSSHWIGTFTDNKQIPDALISYLSQWLPSSENRKIYFDHGTAGLDAYYGKYQLRVDSVLTAKGYTSSAFMSPVFVGETHDENAWKKRFYIPSIFILANISTDISETNKQKRIYVYPNPVLNTLHLVNPGNLNKNIRIYNLAGRMFYCHKPLNDTIDVTGLPAGIYLLKIEDSGLATVEFTKCK
jgi:predicted alpha/beta superfamily hydrolase